MATPMLPIRPAGVIGCATTSRHRKVEANKTKSSSSSNWWGPVFGWSTDPDYIHTSNNNDNNNNNNNNTNNLYSDPVSGSNPNPKLIIKPRFAPGVFTEEKARQLRLMTTETTAFHDAMYHSSIAAKLASDFPKL